MKAILLQDVKGLGRQGEVVEVADGYARNLLIPKGLAALADAKTIETVQNQVKVRELKVEGTGKISLDLAQRLKSQTFELYRVADEKGHLYAGLKDSEIRAKIREVTPLISPEMIQFSDYVPLKTVGRHQVRASIGGNLTEINILIHPATKH